LSGSTFSVRKLNSLASFCCNVSGSKSSLIIFHNYMEVGHIHKLVVVVEVVVVVEEEVVGMGVVELEQPS